MQCRLSRNSACSGLAAKKEAIGRMKRRGSSSCQDVLMQGTRLASHFLESIIDNVTNRDDSDKSAALDHGKMAKLARGHALHDLVDCVGLRARPDLPRHHLSNGLVAK